VEKLIYALWARDGEPRAALNARLRDAAGPALLDLPNLRGLRLNLQDAHVERAEGLRMRCPDRDQPDAVVQVWLDVSHDAFRAPVDHILGEAASRIAAWSVVSSTIIRNTEHPPAPGERTWGWSQVCFLERPDRLDHATWRHNWHALHTRVAIDTQSNFEYVQNLIVRPLTPDAPDYAAIVEECFPPDAMDDPRVFFDAVGDEARFAANTAAMAESCARFIGEGGVDLLPTSQYELRRPG
jgi:hypothetical protein